MLGGIYAPLAPFLIPGIEEVLAAGAVRAVVGLRVRAAEVRDSAALTGAASAVLSGHRRPERVDAPVARQLPAAAVPRRRHRRRRRRRELGERRAHLTIPVADKAKPHRVQIRTGAVGARSSNRPATRIRVDAG